jgi:hypothetical protein
VQGGGCEVDLVPAQVRQFAGPEAVAVGHKDHRGVPVGPPVAFGGPEQPFDLGLPLHVGDRLSLARMALPREGTGDPASN